MPAISSLGETASRLRRSGRTAPTNPTTGIDSSFELEEQEDHQAASSKIDLDPASGQDATNRATTSRATTWLLSFFVPSLDQSRRHGPTSPLVKLLPPDSDHPLTGLHDRDDGNPVSCTPIPTLRCLGDHEGHRLCGIAATRRSPLLRFATRLCLIVGGACRGEHAVPLRLKAIAVVRFPDHRLGSCSVSTSGRQRTS